MADFWSTLFGGGAEKEAAEKNKQALALYQGQSLGALGETYGQATGYGKQAVGAYDPVVALGKQYAPATQLQLDAIGAGGPAGTARASEAMRATPGYDLGIEAVNRRRALAGGWDAGGTDTDLAKYIASQVYAPWMANVNQAAGMGGQYTLAGAGGQATGYGNLASLASQYGTNLTGVYGNVASGTMDANKLQASGEAAGAKNLLGAGLSLASLAVGSGGISNPFSWGGGTSGGAWGASPAMKFANNLFA